MITRDEFGLKSDSGGPITEKEYADYVNWGPAGPPPAQPSGSTSGASAKRPQITEKEVRWIKAIVGVGLAIFDRYMTRKGGVPVRSYRRKGTKVRRHKRKYPGCW